MGNQTQRLRQLPASVILATVAMFLQLRPKGRSPPVQLHSHRFSGQKNQPRAC